MSTISMYNTDLLVGHPLFAPIVTNLRTRADSVNGQDYLEEALWELMRLYGKAHITNRHPHKGKHVVVKRLAL